MVFNIKSLFISNTLLKYTEMNAMIFIIYYKITSAKKSMKQTCQMLTIVKSSDGCIGIDYIIQFFECLKFL